MDKYLIKYVSNVSGNNPAGKKELYWDKHSLTWGNSERASTYTKDEAISELGNLLHIKQQISEIVLVDSVSLPEKEAREVFLDLRDQVSNGPINEWTMNMINSAHNLWRDGTISHEVFSRVIDRILCY